jgi:hypothetical protein
MTKVQSIPAIKGEKNQIIKMATENLTFSKEICVCRGFYFLFSKLGGLCKLAKLKSSGLGSNPFGCLSQIF